MDNYRDYLQSAHWLALADETRRLAGHRCQVCNSGGELHVHHRTYERIGQEFQSDLVALCADCHALFHGKRDVNDFGGWSLVRSLTNEIKSLRAEKARD